MHQILIKQSFHMLLAVFVLPFVEHQTGGVYCSGGGGWGAFALLLLDSPQAHKHLAYSGRWMPAVNRVSLNFYRES